MSMREKIKKSICLEIGEQTGKAGLAITTVICLIMINTNITQLVHCLSQYTLPTDPFIPTSRLPCTTAVINPDLKVAIEYCRKPESLAFFIENKIQLAFNETSTRELVSWLKKCAVHSCTVNQYVRKDTQCPYVSFLNDIHYVCFDINHHVKYLVLSNMQMLPSDSLSVFYFIVHSIA